MNIMNRYGCGAEGVRANEHSLIGLATLRENLRQIQGVLERMFFF